MEWIIADRAFDHLLAIYEQDRVLWHVAHRHGGLRELCRFHDIHPDRE